jgi:hypothetical protein
MSKFDKPYRIQQTFDIKKANNLFNMINKLDTYELKNYSLINQVPLDYINDDGECLIHKVIEIDDKTTSQETKLNIIKFLVQNNVNPDQPNKYNQTPLHLSCMLQFDQIIEYLLSIGVDSNYQDNLGQSPFHYLLKGKIKIVEATKVLDFVQPPTKTNVDKKEKLIQIKTLLWNLIEQNIKNFPILDTIKNTIINLLEEDKDIIKSKIETIDEIKKIIFDISNINKISDIKKIIDIGKKTIENKIDVKFNYINEINDLKMHKKEINSWSPNNITALDDMALIKNGNIKKVIKNDIKQFFNNIKDSVKNFDIIDSISHDINKNGFNEIFSKYINPNNENKLLFSHYENPLINDDYVYLYNFKFDDNNYLIRHHLALDNASCVLDFYNLFYVGSARQIEIYNGLGLSDDEFISKNIYGNLYYTLKFNDLKKNMKEIENKQILYLLSSFIPYSDIEINNITEFTVIKFIADFKIATIPDPVDSLGHGTDNPLAIISGGLPFIDPVKQPFPLNGAIAPILMPYDYFQKIVSKIKVNKLPLDLDCPMENPTGLYQNDINNMKIYTILAFYAIQYPTEFVLIPNKLKDYDELFKDNLFGRKWYHLYIKNINKNNILSSWLFNMWCDLISRLSRSNLDCQMPFKLLMLISGLQNYNVQKIQGIINAYKPQLIEIIFNAANTDNDKKIFLIKWIYLLLNDKIDLQFLDCILYDYINIDKIKDIPSNLKNIIKLIDSFITNKYDPTKVFDSNNPLYEEYKMNNLSTGDVLSNIILDYYNNLNDKPLKQNILDTIFIIKKIDYENNPNIIHLLKNISYKNLILSIYKKNFNKFDSYMKLLPSFHSALNYLIDKENYMYLDENNISFKHFCISHTLGLYYKGLFYKTYFSLNDNIKINNNGKNIELILSIIRHDNPNAYEYFPNSDYDKKKVTNPKFSQSPFHYFIKNDNKKILAEYLLPLPLNYIFIVPPNIINRHIEITDPDPSKPDVSIFLDLDIYNKNFYYDIQNRDIIIPTFHSYLLLLLNRIHYYQKKIMDTIIVCIDYINKIINGNSYHMKDLYMNQYPIIVIYSKILNNFINYLDNLKKEDKYNTNILNTFINNINAKNYDIYLLANNLNNINSNYFLYYYLFSHHNLLKLSKFNYYQIPTDNKSSYYYYYKSDQLLINLNNNDYDDKYFLKKNTGDIDNEPNEKILKKSTINSIGNYDNILNEYLMNQYLTDPTGYATKKSIFIQLKYKKVPPSLYASLSKLYKYGVIKTIEDIIDFMIKNKSQNAVKNIIEYTNELIDKLNLKYLNKELFCYFIIANLIKELIQNQINVYKNNSVNEIYKNIFLHNNILKNNLLLNDELLQIEFKDFYVNLTDCNFDISSKFTCNDTKYIYNIVKEEKKEKIFILYPNDLNNLNKLKDKYYIYINNNIINKLLEYNSSPDIINIEGISAFNNIVKTYNYEIIFDFKYNKNYEIIDSNQLLEYSINDNINNLNKILNNMDNINNELLENILFNINNHLYNDLKAVILGNDKFGNNLLINLDYSFFISSYLTIQYLSEHFMNINNKFRINNLINIFDILKIKFNEKMTNYLADNFKSYNIPDQIYHLIIIEIIDKNKQEYSSIEQKLNEIQSTINELKNNNMNDLAKKIQNSSDYKNLINNKSNKINQIQFFDNCIKNSKYANDYKNIYDSKIINRYKSIPINKGLIIKGWKSMINSKINNNHNLIPLHLLSKQKEYINLLKNNKLNNDKNLDEINKAMEHLSVLCENYFTNQQFTDDNKVLEFIEDLLNYLTEIILGNNIELMLKKILLTYFTNTLHDKTLSHITKIIDYILNQELTGINKNLITYLYKVVCPKLVKNCSEIFKNNSEKKGHIIESVREILTDYFDLLHLTPITLSDEVINIFKIDVINYYEIFVNKIILLWHVNSENIFKYFINNYRCLQTILYLK